MMRHKKKKKCSNNSSSNTTTTTSNNHNRHKTNQGKSNSLEHQLASEIIYTSPYELPPHSKPNIHNRILATGKKADTPTSLVDERLSEVYSPASVSFRISSASLHSPIPPPLPERNTASRRKSVHEESVGNPSRCSSPRIITPPPLIDIKAQLKSSILKNHISPTPSKSNSFRRRRNSVESITSTASKAAPKANNLASNLEVLLEVQESSGPTTMMNSMSSKESNRQETNSVKSPISSPKPLDEHPEEADNFADQHQSSPSSGNEDEEESNGGGDTVISVQVHRNNNSALSRRTSNRSSRKSIRSTPATSGKDISIVQQLNPSQSQPRSTALQQLQALDLFKLQTSEDNEGNEDVHDSDKNIRLETDQYVKQINRRRGKLLSQIDSTPGDRLRRKFGYDIERRLVKVSYSMKNGYTGKKSTKKKLKKKHLRNDHSHRHLHREKSRNNNNPGIWVWIKSMFMWVFWDYKEEHLDEEDLRRKRRRQRYRKRRRRHRFCFRCVTSSFHALFLYLGSPFISLTSTMTHSDELSTTRKHNNRAINNGNTTTTTTSTSNNTTTRETTLSAGECQAQANPRSRSQLSMAATVLTIAESENSRTPTPKMLLDVKHGTLHWPVYQVGGKKGSGMLISTRAIYPAPPEDNLGTKHQPGRENFSLVPVELSPDEKRKGETVGRDNFEHDVIDVSGSGGDGRKLVGWLQVRDPKNKKSFLQVVDPAPKGPFRKAPWHNGNFHVLKL